MPKLNEKQLVAKARNIEKAALEQFCVKGFHGVGLRDIAAAANVSLGNIYNHFGSKEAIFGILVQRLYSEFSAPTEPLALYILDNDFPNDLERFGQVVGEMVKRHMKYLTLVYVDIAEFAGKHVRPHYHELSERFRNALQFKIARLEREGRVPPGIDPAVAFTAIYMQFANYFIIERLIGARHLGLDDADAITALSTLFHRGLDPRGSPG